MSRLVDTHRHSRPKLSRMILTAAGLAIAVILLAWLTVWINSSRRGIVARWVGPRSLARPWIAHQAADAEKIAGAKKGMVVETEYDTFRDELRRQLARAGNRPVVLYVSAAGILDDPGAVLLRDAAGTLSASGDASVSQTPVSMEELLTAFKEAGERFPGQSRFLIWDAGQVGSDRNLGVYGNGFLAKLKSRLVETPVSRLVILSSCAPGQTSWASELDGRSVFGYFVEQGLAGKAAGPNGLTVRSLSTYVHIQVTQWVRSHRQAEQTPVLLGDASLDFTLPRPRKTLVAPRVEEKDKDKDADEVKAFLRRLQGAWARHDEWLKRRPYQAAPRSWLRYQETLLRAERLFRAGDQADAESALGSLPGLASELNRVPMVEGSLALLERQVGDRADEPKRAELEQGRSNIVEALDRLLGGDEAPAPGGAEAAPAANPAAPGAGMGPAPDAPAAPKPAPKKKARTAPGPEPKGEPVPDAKPAADPAETKKDASKISTKSLTSRRRPDSPLARLMVPEDERRPLYPEAQLVVWADTYITRGPDPNAFRGNRGDALESAIQTRKLAEDAAAADERISRWIRPWVENGDKWRRKAQDLLFATNPPIPQCLEALEKADESYKVGLKNGETCQHALELVDQLSAELPYYGEWKARRAGRLEPGLDQPFVDLLGAAAELARRIHATPAPPAGEDRSLAPLDEQVEGIKSQYAVVTEAFRNLTDDFRNHWESSRWRDLDAALCVPLIPAESRMKVLERVRSRTIASALADPSTEVTTVELDPSKSAEGGLNSVGTIYEGVVGRPRGESGLEAGDAQANSDPGFWRAASALARLEIGLMEIGGAKRDDMAALRDAYDRASRKLGTAPFIEFGEISERIRSLRRTRVAVSAEKPAAGRPDDDLEARDRAVRVMPLADSSGRIDRVTEEYLRYARRDLATWLGRRLIDDFSGRQALAVLDKAKDTFGDSNANRAAVEKAKLSIRAGLAVETSAPRQAAMDDQNGIPLGVKVKAEGEVPTGEAVAFVAYDRSLPVAVTDAPAKAARPEGASVVTVGQHLPEELVRFVVERADSTPSAVTVRLGPGAFYRGRIFPKDLSAAGIVVRLEPSKEGIDVILRQSNKDFVRLYGDQFERHPGQGFLHPNSSLGYRLVINHTLNRSTTVWVKYGLDGKPETLTTKANVKLEPGRPNTDIYDEVFADKHEIPVDKPRYLEVEMRKDNENGRQLFKRRYPFRQILPQDYLRVQDGFDEEIFMAFVDVWHLKSDPVCGPSDVSVTLGGQTLRTYLNRGYGERWWRVYPQAPVPVPWRISVESYHDAFKGKVETGVEPQKAPQAPPQAPPQ